MPAHNSPTIVHRSLEVIGCEYTATRCPGEPAPAACRYQVICPLAARSAPQVEQAARLATPAPAWSKPPSLPCRRSRRQVSTHLSTTSLSNAIRPARLRAPPHAAAPVEQPARLAPCAGGWLVSFFHLPLCAPLVRNSLREAVRRSEVHKKKKGPDNPAPQERVAEISSPCRRDRRAWAPSSSQESRTPELRWSASAMRSKLRSGERCGPPWWDR